MHSPTSKAQANNGQSVAENLSKKENKFAPPSQFADNRAESAAQKEVQLQIASANAQQPYSFQGVAEARDEVTAMLKKDAALWSKGDKGGGYTSTKVVNTKSGKKGAFRFPMNGNCIDTFIGTNAAKKEDLPFAHADAEIIDIPTRVADCDLTQAGLDDNEVKSGNRALHFAAADQKHGVDDRENKYTWHHKMTKGKMELVDMNVHGAMWHYGGIAGWDASVHDGDKSDDDPSDE